MSENPLPSAPPDGRRRRPYEEGALRPGGAARRASVLIYCALVLLLAGVVFYMGAVVGHPLLSPYVIAPAVGALWFALRLFMNLAPRR